MTLSSLAVHMTTIILFEHRTMSLTKRLQLVDMEPGAVAGIKEDIEAFRELIESVENSVETKYRYDSSRLAIASSSVTCSNCW